MHSIAMMFWLKHATNSATIMGTLMMVSMLPGVILGPLGGTFVDRHSRRKVIIFCDLICGLVVLALAAMLFYLPAKTDLIVTWLTISYIIMGISGAAFGPAMAAAIPDLVPKDKIAAANSMNRSSTQICSFLGMGAGGVLFRVLGAPMLFLFDSFSFLFASASTLFVKIPQVYPEKVSGFAAIFSRFKKDTAEGFQYVWHNKGLRSLIFSAAFLNFFLAPIGVMFPFFIEDFLKATSDWFGYLLAAMGVGALVGYLLAGAIRIPGRIRSPLIISLIFCMSLLFALLGLMTQTIPALILIFVIGMLSAVVNLYLSTIIQTTTPTEIRGRVFGLMGTIVGGLSPIAMGLAGVIADLTGKNVPLIFGFCGGMTALLTIIVSLNSEFRKFLAYEYPAKKTETTV